LLQIALEKTNKLGNMNVWIDSSEDVVGDVRAGLTSAIRNCDVVFACLSEDFFESFWCQREMHLASVERKIIIPVNVGKKTLKHDMIPI